MNNIKPKILHVVHEGTMTGAPLAAAHTAKLIESDCNSTIVCIGPISELYSTYCEVTTGKKPLSSADAANFDLVICHSAATAKTTNDLINAKQKVMWWIHEDSHFFDCTPSSLINHCLQNAPGLVFVSPHCAYRTFSPWTWKRNGLGIHIVPNCARSSPVQARPTKTTNLNIIHIATLSRSKGTDLVLNLAKDPLAHGWLFHIIGRLIDHDLIANIPKNVLNYGEVSPNQALALMAKADLMLHPSRLDNQPLVVLEALANNLPVISSVLPSLDCYADKRHGYFSTPLDVLEDTKQIFNKIIDVAGKTARLPYEFSEEHHKKMSLEAIHSVLQT